MALFKKKIEDKDSKDIPDFPSSFAPDIRFPEFPGYGQDTNPFREPPKSFESLKPIPKEDKYESLLDQPLSPQMQPPLNKPMNMQPRYQFQEMPQKSFGMVKDEQRQVFHEDKPIFVKIDDYEEAIYTLDKIKSKLKEADRILEELNKIRAEEEKQLEEWKQDLISIKEKLLTIDKKLFENQ
ncbi:MAG: hypothetical protein AABW41_02550 [Nanoarchaeota archaeon]